MAAQKGLRWFIFGLTCLLLAGCSLFEVQQPAESQVDVSLLEPELHVKLTFNVRVPLNTPADQPIYLHLLDEVTGAEINQVTYQLPASGEDYYTININVPVDSVVLYRYSNNVNSPEINLTGATVSYRMVHAYQHTVIEDTIAGWVGQQIIPGNYGRLSGTILDEAQNPVSGIVICVAGMETVSDENGNYVFDFLPIGTHNLVAYAPDGSFQVFQQLAMIGTDLETKAPITMAHSQFVQVVFIVSVPDGILQAIPVRLVGNFAQLGGYADVVWNGVGVSAANAPVMTRGSDGKHRLEVKLPVGAELHYKYTLGDSVWSGEQSETGKFFVRRLIVPDHDLLVEDEVATWNNSEFGEISLITRVPEELRQGDVWIQFRYGLQDWMEPIPMWPVTDGEWFAVLTSPLNDFVNVKYRYCLNGNCDETPEANQDGYLIQRNLEVRPEIQNIEDTIIAWRVVEP